MVYPAQNMNESVQLLNISQNHRSFDYIYLVGPYIDELNLQKQNNTLLSLNKMQKYNFGVDEIEYNLRNNFCF